jgi:hypothetical protein
MSGGGMGHKPGGGAKKIKRARLEISPRPAVILKFMRRLREGGSKCVRYRWVSSLRYPPLPLAGLCGKFSRPQRMPSPSLRGEWFCSNHIQIYACSELLATGKLKWADYVGKQRSAPGIHLIWDGRKKMLVGATGFELNLGAL